MLDGLKTRNSAPEKLRQCLKSSIWVLSLASVAIICYSIFSISGGFRNRWQCPVCDSYSAAVNPPAKTPTTTGARTNISHVMFGIGGSETTWQRRKSYIELWWRPGVTRGYVWLDTAPVAPWPESSPPFEISTNTSRYGNRADAARIARIAAEAYAAAPEGTRWFVMGDDDTVFFVENLVAVLGRYDHEEMWYIGASSESVEQDVMHSYAMAFGGGGFAVSRPAAAAFAGAIDGCLDRYAEFYGSDQRVHACFGEIGVPLTRQPGFHQVDLKGDIYGMLAAHPVAPLISLHHLDYVKPIDPRGTQLTALQSLVNVARSDPGRTLQQAICYVHEPGRRINWSVSVSWGYTVQLYPWIIPPKDIVVPLQTFRTWRSSSNGPFTFNTRIMPGPDQPCLRPLVYFLDQVQDAKNGNTVTEYSRYKTGEEKGVARCDKTGSYKVRTVKVSAPRMDPNFWTQKAPRRQCCEAHRVVGWFGSRIMEVIIRDCNPGEITSPP